MFKKLLLAGCLVSFSLAGLNCFGLGDEDEDSNPTGPGTSAPSPSTHILMMEMSYKTNGNSLIVYENGWECMDSVAVAVQDTDTTVYSIDGNTMIVYEEEDSGNLEEMKFIRQGSGSGMQGTWKYDPTTLDPEDKEMMEEAILYISATKIQMWMPIAELQPMMEEMVSEMSLAFSSLEAYFTIDTSTPGEIKITGNTTNEVVTIGMNSSGELAYSSSNPDHETYTLNMFDDKPNCSNDDDFGPAWLEEFMLDNIDSSMGGVMKRTLPGLVPAW